MKKAKSKLKLPGKNDGEYLEDGLAEELQTEKSSSFYYRRLFDTHTAGKGMPPQPADFDIAWFGYGSCHMECKTSESTTSRLVKFSQLGDMLRWGKAGKPGLVLVHFYNLQSLYIFNVADIKNTTAPSWVVPEIPHSWAIQGGVITGIVKVIKERMKWEYERLFGK